jgi:hypothetical protein
MKASDAAALADLIYLEVEGKPLTDDVRNRFAARVSSLGLDTFTPFPGSLQQDPIHPSTYYIAVDANSRLPTPDSRLLSARSLLLSISLASSPPSGLFPESILIGRMRPGGGREIVINAISFDSVDHANIRTFAEQVDRAFLPRPQGAQPAIAAGNRHPEVSLPAVFQAFRSVLKSTGVNLASTVQLSATREMTTAAVIAQRDGENPTAAGHTRVSIEHLYHAGLWAAIRAGWRDGYNAEADHFIVTGNTDDEICRSVESAKRAIEAAAGYTKFTTDTSRLFEIRADARHPHPWSDSEVEEQYGIIFTPEEQKWLAGEFPQFDRTVLRRLAVKFGRSLKLNEELYDYIAAVKSRQESRTTFDFEPSLDEAETLTTPDELRFYMHWLKARGRPAQLVPPNLGFKKRQAYPETLEQLGVYVHHKMWPELAPRVTRQFRGKPLAELGARVNQLAEVAREFDGTLSIHSGSGKQRSVLAEIGRATGGRFNYKISGELQLQLFDVLSEQPRDSAERALYDRMVDRALTFAEAGAFGEESALAKEYPGRYLGDADRGRVDGNLFLVFWLGNVVGSRDADGEFFKDQLDRLPNALIEEVRERNARYVRWLASCLVGKHISA